MHMLINKKIWGKTFGRQLLKTMWIFEKSGLRKTYNMLVSLFENHLFLRLVDKST